MERNEATAKTHLLKLFPDYDSRAVSEYESNPVNPETGNRLSKRLVEWLKSEVGDWYSYERFLVNLSWPNVETVESRLMIKMWLNQDDRNKGIAARRLMKPGKALRHLFPFLSDSRVEYFVDRLRLELGERAYTLKTGKDADTFRDVYTGDQCKMENPATTNMRKSLANSCMRYESIMHRDCNGVMRHPAEAYASGEFGIVYVTDHKGHIAARCVVWNGPEGESGFKPVPAPIYGVCEKSMDMVQEYLDSIGAIDSDWIGARLDVIEHDTNQWIAPYLDLAPRELNCDGDSLIVTRYGNIDASNYSGILGDNPNMCPCENCGDRYDPDEEGGLVGDQHVCDSCWTESNFCYYYYERTFEDVETVYLWRIGRRYEQTWCDSAVSDYAERVNGDWWRADDLYTDYEGNYITPEQVGDGEYFLSEWDGEFYPSTMMCETSEGEVVSKIELDDDRGVWEQDNQGVWHNVQLDLDLEGKAA